MKPATGGSLGESGVAEPIVSRTFVRIHQYIVGFADLFEFIFGVRIFRIFIRMKFDCELAIGALDLLLGDISLHPEDFIVITLFCRHFM